MSEMIESVEIAPDTYWIGKRDPRSIFHANPFLRIFRGQGPDGRTQHFNLLIDPGSKSDFSVVSTKAAELLGGLNRVSAIWVNHQDPDVGSSAPLIIGKHAPRASVICSEATWRLICHYGLPRDRFYPTDRVHGGKLQLPTGGHVVPVPSPFCHFRGAVMMYDPETRVLFSGDLFGGLTDIDAQGIWADESDWRGIRAFHQAYMPSSKALVHAIDAIRKLTPKVEMIAPQHGRIIRGPLIETFMERLARLPVGLDILDGQENSAEALTGWTTVVNRVLEVARMYLGSRADERLVSAPELDEEVIAFEAGGVRLLSTPRWAAGVAVEALAAGEAPAIANAIKQEAIVVADELDLPAPDIALEETPNVETLNLDQDA